MSEWFNYTQNSPMMGAECQKNRSIYQRIFVNCVFWKYFCFWSICRLFHLVFTKNYHQNSVGKTFLGCSYHLNGIKEWYSFWAKVFAIPYRKLAQVGFESTTSCLQSTRSNHWVIWPNDEMCLMVYRSKWPQSSSHRCNIYDIYIISIHVLYLIYIYDLFIRIVLFYYYYIYIYILINKPLFWC